MELRPLGKTGIVVSRLGYGASPLGGEFGVIDEDEGIRSVHRAIDLGIRLFDVAPYYGRTRAETVLGRALAGRRDEVVLCSKVGRYGKDDFDFRPERILPGLEESLERLGTDHLDLVIVHDIEFRPLAPILEATIPALVRAREQGKVRAIGVSGLPLGVLERAVDGAELDFVLSYCRYTLQDRSLTDSLMPKVRRKGMGLLNAAPLAMGLLTQFDPPPWHPAPLAVVHACKAAARHCAERGADLADVALAFALANSEIDSTIVGMPTIAQVERNLKACLTPADPVLVAEIEEILAPVRGVSWPSGLPENQD
ncbi:MAG: aldo/keto reductase [Isosphaeraceae bacterium]|nr:aldo/keto reductase [Isosphaeraceae bacterium]